MRKSLNDNDNDNNHNRTHAPTRQGHGRSGHADTRGLMLPPDLDSYGAGNEGGGEVDAEKGAYERLQGMLKNDG